MKKIHILPVTLAIREETNFGSFSVLLLQIELFPNFMLAHSAFSKLNCCQELSDTFKFYLVLAEMGCG